MPQAYVDRSAETTDENERISPDDLVAVVEATDEFYVGCSGDSSLDRAEDGVEVSLILGNHVDALNHLRLGRCTDDRVGIDLDWLASVCGQRFFLQDITLNEGLNGNSEDVGLVGGGDFGGGR